MMHVLRRALPLMLTAGMLAVILSGCFTFSFPELGGSKDGNDTSAPPLFDPDGNDDPLSGSTESAGTSTQPTDAQKPSEDPTEQETEPTQKPEDPTEEPTQAPTQPPTQPTDPLPADPIAYGLIIVDILNVRSGPGTNYDVDALIYKNARVAIYERKGDWGRIKNGWIALEYVYIDGTEGPDGSVMGTVNGMTVRIRSGPGTNYNVNTVVDTGDRLEILFRVTLDDMEWGCTKQGWICMDYVTIDGE